MPGAWLAPVYVAVYLSYLFVRGGESEQEHWISMVVVPLGLATAVAWQRGDEASSRRLLGRRSRLAADLRTALASLGFRRGRLTDGLVTAIVAGAIVGVVQVRFARSGEAFAEAVASGRIVWLLPLAFLLLLFLAGFTEEVLFRGFLQTRLSALTRSRWAGWIAASIAFGIYHVPYAYYNPQWPSAGDWGAAWSTAMWEGGAGGLLLGGLFLWSRGNVVACIVLHALMDAIPAVSLIHFGGS